MSTAVPGRVICPRCGANNFETQAACWKCGSLLSGGAPAPALSPAGNAPSVGGSPSSAAMPPPASGYVPPSGAADRMYRPSVPVDPSVAMWCGVLLAIFFPFFAVPVGLVFMMLDDRRRLEVGRVTLIVGIISSIIQFLITAAAMGSLIQTGLTMAGQRVMQRTNPGLNDSVSDQDLKIPGIPGLGNGKPSAPVTLPDPNAPEVPFPEAPRR